MPETLVSRFSPFPGFRSSRFGGFPVSGFRGNFTESPRRGGIAGTARKRRGGGAEVVRERQGVVRE